jgi:hypothetical protein
MCYKFGQKSKKMKNFSKKLKKFFKKSKKIEKRHIARESPSDVPDFFGCCLWERRR